MEIGDHFKICVCLKREMNTNFVMIWLFKKIIMRESILMHIYDVINVRESFYICLCKNEVERNREWGDEIKMSNFSICSRREIIWRQVISMRSIIKHFQIGMKWEKKLIFLFFIFLIS